MLMMLGSAWAAPPLPTWSYGEDRFVEAREADHETLTVGDDDAVRAPTTTTVAFEPPVPPRHAWADEAALTFDLSEEVGRFNYVLVTARGERGLVAHWRLGPFAGEDATQTFALEWPPELSALLPTLGPVRLTLDVVVVDARDVELGRSRLGVTWAAAQDGRPVGGVRVDDEEAP